MDFALHRLAPAGVSTRLLDERFVCFSSEGELGLLRFVGLRQLQRSAFFREHVFTRLTQFPAAERDAVMLSALHDLHALNTEDAGMIDALRQLAFVPVRSGALRRASELFHPKVSEAAEILDASEAFPAGAFASEEVLGVL